MNREEYILYCRKEADECSKLHAKWSAFDRRWNILISALVLWSAVMSLIHGIWGNLIHQLVHAGLTFLFLKWLRTHVADRSTADFLEFRQTLLDMAHKQETRLP